MSKSEGKQRNSEERTFRPARRGEHEVLTALALRSVQERWDYSDAFMAWEPEAITVAAEDMDQATVVVCEDGGFLCGFYMLRGAPPEIEMSRLMVDPLTFGTGLGRRLWNHAVETAAQMGAEAMTLDADPNAEAFYLRMGAETVGEHDWEPPMMPGWRVKKMVFRIQPT